MIDRTVALLDLACNPVPEPPSQTFSSSKARGRTGRRPGRPETRLAVLNAARAHFVERGYTGTRLRDVAATAGVDVALVHYFFRTKDSLFAAAMELPIDPGEAAAGLLDGPREEVPRRILERFLGIWDAPGAADPLIALVRSAATHEPAAELLRGFIHHGILGPLLRRLEVDQPERRAALAASLILGLVLIRYVVRVEPLASERREWVIAALEPALAHHVFGTLGDG